jgi:hypothetical protein
VHLDGADPDVEPSGFLARQLALRATLGPLDSHRLALDSQVRRGDSTSAIDERELERLAVGKIREARLLDRRNVNEDVLASIVTDDEAEALLRIEEFYDAFSFADNLRRHSATAAAAAAKATATAAAETTTAAAAEAATVTAVAATAAAAEAIAAAAEATASATAKATAVGKSAAIAVALFSEKSVALVSAATTAVPLTPSIETHARPNSLCPQSLRTNALGPKSATGQVRHLLTHRSAP